MGLGRNSTGIFGTGTREEQHTPVRIMTDVVFARAGGNAQYINFGFAYAAAILAIKTDGSLWGIRESGAFKIMDDVVYVDTCYSHTAAIKTDGSLWAWGVNNSGAVGDGTTDGEVTNPGPMGGTMYYRNPKKILENVATVSVTGNRTTALLKDNSLWSWGILANGSPAETKPTKVLDKVASFQLSNIDMVIKTDGSLWAWGDTGGSYLGNGSHYGSIEPVKIMDDVVAVSGDTYGAAAIKSDGTLWAWGLSSGKAFDNIQSSVSVIPLTPVKVMNDVVAINSNGMNTTAIKKDGSLWSWGENQYGQIGNGTISNEMAMESPKKTMDGVKLSTAAIMPSPVTPSLTATPTVPTVLVNGENVTFDAYNIGGNNYFKLRDLAYNLSGTEKQFDVSWDGVHNAISLTSGKAYTVVGGEMGSKSVGTKTPVTTSSKIYLDGKELSLTAYTIDGNNYFKLRNIGEAFDFGVEWDGANNTIVIDVSKDYTAE